MAKPFVITFAGPFGCGKSPVAQFLSCELGVPLLANDVLRNEMREDEQRFAFDQDAYVERVIERIHRLVAQNRSFVYDASNDRQWLRFLDNFPPASYDVGVISFDLSAEFYRQLLAIKQYDLEDEAVQNYLAHHAEFLDAHASAVVHHITDQTYKYRLQDSLAAVRHFLG